MFWLLLLLVASMWSWWGITSTSRGVADVDSVAWFRAASRHQHHKIFNTDRILVYLSSFWKVEKTELHPKRMGKKHIYLGVPFLALPGGTTKVLLELWEEPQSAKDKFGLLIGNCGLGWHYCGGFLSSSPWPGNTWHCPSLFWPANTSDWIGKKTKKNV